MTEAEMEIETLQAVYDEDLQILEPGKRIAIPVQDPSNDDPEAMRCELRVEFGDDYPDVAPNLSVRGIKALTRAQVEPLLGLLNNHANDLLGTQMVFELVTFIQEWLANGAEDPNAKEEVVHTGPMVLENKSKHGTPVTPEVFAAWKAAFEEEMAKKKKTSTNDNIGPDGEVKLTGRQIFDKAIDTVDWELFKEGDFDEEDLPEFEESDEDDDSE